MVILWTKSTPPPPGTWVPPSVTFEPPKLRKQIICQNVCLWTPYRYPRAKAGKKIGKNRRGGVATPPPP